MRRLAVASLLLLAGCGGGAPSSVVPADATVYLGVSAAEAERIMGGTSRADVEFERDVKPWLGERAAYFAITATDESGLVFDVEDEDAAEAFARKVTAAGPLRASAIIDGKLVLTSSRELLRAADAASGGQALADSTRLDVAGEDEEGAPDFLFALADRRLFARGLEAFEIPAEAPVPLSGDGPITARVWDDFVEVTGLAASPPAPSLANLPGDAQVAIAAVDLSAGDPLAHRREALDHWPARMDLEPLLRHAGAGTMAVQGQGAQIVAEVSNKAALRRAVSALARGLPRRRYHVDLDQLENGTLHLLVSPRLGSEPHFLVAVGERLVIETGEPSGGSAQDLGDTARYRAAERRLGGPPSMLIGDLAVRDDGRGTVRISRAGG
jgi:hypothetical protein